MQIHQHILLFLPNQAKDTAQQRKTYMQDQNKHLDEWCEDPSTLLWRDDECRRHTKPKYKNDFIYYRIVEFRIKLQEFSLQDIWMSNRN